MDLEVAFIRLSAPQLLSVAGIVVFYGIDMSISTPDAEGSKGLRSRGR